MYQRKINIYKIILLSVCITSSIQINAIAATKPLKQQPKKIQQKNVLLNTKPLDLDCNRFEKNYTGHDLKKVFTTLYSRFANQEKGEYETTEEHKRRIIEERQKPVFGNLGMNDLFCYVYTPETKYDADINRLSLKIDTWSVNDNTGEYGNYSEDKSRVGILGSYIRHNLGEYTASNAFGALVEVSKYREERFLLALKKSDIPFAKDENSGILRDLFVYDITPEMAKKIRDQVRIAFIYQLESPYISKAERSRKPTRDYPEDRTINFFNVLAGFRGAWVFNNATGEILLKVPAAE
jgi:hypothetical protein